MEYTHLERFLLLHKHILSLFIITIIIIITTLLGAVHGHLCGLSNL